jgi:hypothetical protein
MLDEGGNEKLDDPPLPGLDLSRINQIACLHLQRVEINIVKVC